MANVAFLWDNAYVAPSTTLTASSSASALPVASTQNPERTAIWRSLAQGGEHTIDIDLGSVESVEAVAVANVRLLTSGALVLQQRGDASSPGSAVDVVTLPAAHSGRRAAAARFTAEAHRHWRLRWTNPLSVIDFVELGYAHLGGSTVPTRNFTAPIDVSQVDPSVVHRSPDGQVAVTTRSAFMRGVIGWEALDDADRTALEAIYAGVGHATPIFVVLNEDLDWTTWFVRFVAPVRYHFLKGIRMYGVALEWEEVR